MENGRDEEEMGKREGRDEEKRGIEWVGFRM